MDATPCRSRCNATMALVTIALLASIATASGAKLAPATNAQWESECASCHVAYPPRMLPASSWRAIMNGLNRHFGADASVDAATAESIRTFLETRASRDRGAPSATPVLRITETPRFVARHDEIPAAVWRSKNVKSPANCGACHAGAERGYFSDDDVHIPRQPPARPDRHS